MKPPKRQRVIIKKEDIPQFGTIDKQWNLEERKNLLNGLKLHADGDVMQLRKFVPTRTEKEIGWYIERLKNKRPEHIAHKRGKPTGLEPLKTNAPLEQWISKVSELMHNEEEYSDIMGRVFSVAGNLEPHATKVSRHEPDYTAIYLYISALLNQQPLPSLSPIDSAVVVDLIQGLVEKLRGLDITKQQKLMQMKYQLLDLSVKDHGRDVVHSATKKALEEDLLNPSTRSQGEHSCAAPTPSTSNVSPDSEKVTEHEGERSPPTKAKKMQRSKKGVKPPRLAVKTPLYSINPFVINPEYLNPLPRGSAL